MSKSMKIRKDDTVVVTGGKDRGKTGRVLRTDPAKRRVYVEGLNMVKRRQRPRSIKDTQKSAQAGGIIEKEGPIHVSNVMLLDPDRQQADPRRRPRGRGRQARALREAHRQRDRVGDCQRWKRPPQKPNARPRRRGCAISSRARSPSG